MGWTTTGLRPLGHYVLVRLDEQTAHSPSGVLYIPDACREQQTTGVVIAVGPGKFDEHGVLRRCELQPGDRVFVGKWNGFELEPPDDDASARGRYWVLDMTALWNKRGRTAGSLREADIYAKVEP